MSHGAIMGYMLVQAILPTILLDEFKSHMEQWITDKNRVLVIQGPEGEEIEHLGEKTVRQLVERKSIEDVAGLYGLTKQDLSGLDGFAVCKELKSTPAYSDIKVMVVSGFLVHALAGRRT